MDKEQNGIKQAFITGYERMSAWSGVLDEINVFPVADGDTGRNLMISLAPLRWLGDRNQQEISEQLMFSARGNSGNIAVQFISELLKAKSPDGLETAAEAGMQNARKAINDPRPGTMLTVLDRFAEALRGAGEAKDFETLGENVIDTIQEAVRQTPELLPELREAGVVDAGALAMFLFLEGFLKNAWGPEKNFRSVHEIFGDRICLAPDFDRAEGEGYCVDLVMRMDKDFGSSVSRIAESDQSATVYTFSDYAKLHLHTRDVRELKQKAEQIGEIVQWNEDDLERQVKQFRLPETTGPVHIVTDAAGSLTREMARRLGVTLLESYVNLGNTSVPETCVNPEDLYRAMRRNVKASTSQASVFERHQHYARLLEQYENVLYLCVGSVYTGNYQVVMDWKKEHDPDGRITVIDTGAASGRLAAAVTTTAGYAARSENPQQVIEFAGQAAEKSGEFIFLDELKYLAAGGRMSKTGAFFGDMLHMKPVITPMKQGAEKVGIVRNAEAQISFAAERLPKILKDDPDSLILLEYTDNLQWVKDRALAELRRLFSSAQILVEPLSLTSGVHIGPGAWAVAWYGDRP